MYVQQYTMLYLTINMYAQNVQIDKLLKPGVRVTVRIQESTKPSKFDSGGTSNANCTA